RDLEAIIIDAVQANLNTIMNDMGEVEGGLSIRRPDGAYFINNGMANFDYNVQLFEYLHDDTISWNGQWYETKASSAKRFMIGSFRHSGAYLKFNMMLRLSGYSPLNSEYMYIRVIEFGGDIGYSPVFKYLVRRGESSSKEISIYLGRPTFKPSMFYLEVMRDPGGTGNADNLVQARANRAWIDG